MVSASETPKLRPSPELWAPAEVLAGFGLDGERKRDTEALALARALGSAQSLAEGRGLEPRRAVKPGSFQGSCLTS